MERKFDPTKPVQFRNGNKTRIICTDAAGGYPIISLRRHQNGEELPYCHLPDGRLSEDKEHPFDLINIPEKRTVYLNLYPNGVAAYIHEIEAKMYANDHAIAIALPVEIEV